MRSKPESGWLFSGSHSPKPLGGQKLKPGLVTYFDGSEPLHAWQRPIDALKDATGPWVQRVNLSSTVTVSMGRVAGCERTVVTVADASAVLTRFAALCASRVAHIWGAPRVVSRYLASGERQHRVPAAHAIRCGASRLPRRVTSHTIARWAAVWAATIDCPRYSAKFASEDAALAMAWHAARYSDEPDVYHAALAVENRWQNEQLETTLAELLR